MCDKIFLGMDNGEQGKNRCFSSWNYVFFLLDTVCFHNGRYNGGPLALSDFKQPRMD